MRRWRDKWASTVIVLAVSLLRRSPKSLAASALASCGSSATKKVPRVITIPPATQARYRRVSRLYLGGVQKRRSKDMVGRGEADREKCSFSPLHPAFFSLFLSAT